MRVCPICHHGTFAHPYQYEDGQCKPDDMTCKVAVRRVRQGTVFFEACGCDGTGAERPLASPTVLAPPPPCVICGEFATIAGTWCGPEHRDLTLAAARGLVQSVTPAPQDGKNGTADEIGDTQ